MSTPFQNRLVGTIIISAAAIIFLPDLLDGKKNSQNREFGEIPTPSQVTVDRTMKSFPQAQLKQLPEEPIVDEIALDDEEQAALQLADNKTKVLDDNEKVIVEQVTPPKPFDEVKVNNDTTITTEQADTQAHETAWVIQLGSFKHKKNVDALVEKLKSQGYVVFTRPIKTRSGYLTKVFVGPELNRQTLEDQLASLEKITQTKGKIAQFQPTQ